MRRWVLLVWGCFVVRAIFYTCVIPLWDGFDEFSHYARIEFLAMQGREPSATTELPADVAETLTRVPSHDGGMSVDEYWKRLASERQRGGFVAPQAFIYEAQQPPLFYWLLAPLYRATAGLSLLSRVIAMRIAGVLFASASIPLGFLIARRVLGESCLALGTAALIALLPLLTFTATHICNDTLAIALGPLVILFALEGRGRAMALALGAALLTKAYFIALLPPIAALLFVRKTRTMAAIALIGALALSGWWFVRNVLTGRSITGSFILADAAPARIFDSVWKANWPRAADFAWMTFIWTGNWDLLMLRSWMYRVMAVVAIIAFAGVVHLIRRRNPEVALITGFIASFIVALCYFAAGTLAVSGDSLVFGWYACCLAAPIVVIWVAGLRAAAPERIKRLCIPILAIAFATVELFGTHVYLLPYYSGFIAHLPNGGLPALRAQQLLNGGFRTMFERLTEYKPEWLSPPILIGVWVLYVLATIALAAFTASALFWRPRCKPN